MKSLSGEGKWERKYGRGWKYQNLYLTNRESRVDMDNWWHKKQESGYAFEVAEITGTQGSAFSRKKGEERRQWGGGWSGWWAVGRWGMVSRGQSRISQDRKSKTIPKVGEIRSSGISMLGKDREITSRNNQKWWNAVSSGSRTGVEEGWAEVSCYSLKSPFNPNDFLKANVYVLADEKMLSKKSPFIFTIFYSFREV